MTQFLILKSQACTSHMQAAQIDTPEVQERKRLEVRQHIGEPSLHKAGQNRPSSATVPCAVTQKAREQRWAECAESRQHRNYEFRAGEGHSGLGTEGEAGSGLAERRLGRHGSGHSRWVEAQRQDSGDSGQRPLADRSDALL